MFKKSWIYFNLLLLQSLAIYSQNPVAFKISSEEGLPNQTIYSITQDKKGFIWLGTDAGIFKYDGIRYSQFKNSKQKSLSLTGLVQNTNGDIYGFNFNGQIFYLQNDSLQLTSSWDKGNISNLCVDIIMIYGYAITMALKCFHKKQINGRIMTEIQKISN